MNERSIQRNTSLQDVIYPQRSCVTDNAGINIFRFRCLFFENFNKILKFLSISLIQFLNINKSITKKLPLPWCHLLTDFGHYLTPSITVSRHLQQSSRSNIFPDCFFTPFMNFSLCLSLAFFPSTMPVKTMFSASSLFITCPKNFICLLSAPFSILYHKYVLTSLFLMSIDILLHVKTAFILLSTLFAIAILFLILFSHLQSSVTMLSRSQE